MRRLVIFGVGGFGREIYAAVRHRGGDVAFADDHRSGTLFGLPLLEPGEIDGDDEIAIAIASPEARRCIAARFANFASIVAPTAIIGPDVSIAEGAIFCDFTMVTASAQIGRHFHCNIYSYVAHDCVIGDFVTFAPKVCCNGNVHIGDGAYVGTGAILKQGMADKPLIIGEGAVIGCGAVVVKDVPAFATVVGNPAKPLPRCTSGQGGGGEPVLPVLHSG